MQLYIEKLTCISSRHRLLGSIRDRVALDRIERALLGDFELPCQHLQKQNIAINPKLVFNNIVKAFDMSSQFNALQLQQVWKTLLENLFGYNTVHIRHNTVQFVDKDTNRHTTFKATRTVTELLVCDNNQILFSLEVVP
ncbi:MAG: hypothetical protein FWF58_02250, partial [Firmicutes bacterium]|nr:hypothetical protein [Bacillota bacterium]